MRRDPTIDRGVRARAWLGPKTKHVQLRCIGLCVLGGVLFALSGCFAFSPVADYIGAETYTLINTDKLIVDHIASASQDRDCSSVKAIEGEPYCRVPPVHESERTYCYRTLGQVNCFDRPDPAYARLGVPVRSGSAGKRMQERPAGVR